MRPSVRLAAVVFLAAVALAVAPPPERAAGLVAADHRLASEAGAAVLADGGNAVDAAVAAALAATVVQPAGSGLGGGGFAVLGLGGERVVLDFRETAPAAAHRDLYRTPDGGVHPTASRVGGLAVGVPGEPRGLAKLVLEHGRLTPEKVAAPAIELARRGFPVGHHLAAALASTKYPGVQALFTSGGALAGEGDVVRREDLARTLKRWAQTQGEHLATGDGAAEIVSAVAAAGGVITAADLAGYAPVERPPLVGTYRGLTIVTMPPPSSGGVFLLQMLGVLEGFDVASLGHDSSDHVHLLAEVMKHAYADRAHHLGDPDFVEVPVARLTSGERVSEIRRAIWPTRTFPPEHYGPLVAPPRDAGTHHISVVDAGGGAVALTTTINTSFGSGVIAGGTGVVLNNQMDDFSAAPGVPNAYGLVGSDANAVAPGKRPLSSMTPTLVFDAEGKLLLSVGGSGGSNIITAVLQVVSDVVDFGMDPAEAVSAPRMHHQWQPDALFLEPGFPADVVRNLEARGHVVQVREGFSAVQLVKVESDALVGASDPRKGGWPAGVR